MFHRLRLLALGILRAFPIASNTLTLFAIAPFVSVERAFVHQFVETLQVVFALAFVFLLGWLASILFEALSLCNKKLQLHELKRFGNEISLELSVGTYEFR